MRAGVSSRIQRTAPFGRGSVRSAPPYRYYWIDTVTVLLVAAPCFK
jgi:hypothetical protein